MAGRSKKGGRRDGGICARERLHRWMLLMVKVVGVWMDGRGQIKEVRNSAGEGEREGAPLDSGCLGWHAVRR